MSKDAGKDAGKDVGKDAGRDIELRVGDKRIPLNIFAKHVILGALLGMLGALKDVDLDEGISIRVGPARP